MRPSIKAITAIKQREQCRLTSYKLPGEKYYTIGWGHYCDRTPSLNKPGAKITQAQADAFLVEDVTEKTNILNSFIKVDIDQDLYDALVSTMYQYNPKNLYLRNIFKHVNIGAPLATIAKLIRTMPSNSYNKKARKVDALLATTGKVYNIDKV